MATLVNREAWLFYQGELLHGYITSQSLPTSEATLLADSADYDYVTTWASDFLLTPNAVRQAITEQIRRLAHIAEQFDREQAIYAPLTQRGEKYAGVDI